jgi:hypothetical protein
MYLDGIRLNCTQEQVAKFNGEKISSVKSEANADPDIRSSGMVKFRFVCLSARPDHRIRTHHW